MSSDQLDKKVLTLINAVKMRRADLDKQAAVTKQPWKTNCSVSLNWEGSTNKLNLATLSEDDLVKVLAFLQMQRDYLVTSRGILGLLSKQMLVQGYTIEDWELDCLKRVAVLTYNQRKTELETLEARLNTLMSEDVRRQMDLEAIEAQLKGLS